MPDLERWTWTNAAGDVLDFNAGALRVLNWSGFGLLDVQAEETPNAGNGVTVRNVRYGARRMMLDILIAPSTATDAPGVADSLISQLRSIEHGKLIEGTLRRERYDGSTITIRCSLRSGLLDNAGEHLGASWIRRASLEFVALSPELRDPTQQSMTATLSESSRTPLPTKTPVVMGWRDVPFRNAFAIDYTGTMDSQSLRVAIGGGATNPVITNIADPDRSRVAFSGIVPPGATLNVDMGTSASANDPGGFSAQLDTGTNWVPYLDITSRPVPLLAGEANEILVGCASGSPSVTVSWYQEYGGF